MRRTSALAPALVCSGLLLTAGLPHPGSRIPNPASSMWIGATQNAPAPTPPPAQFPPLGSGVSADEKVTLQAAVDQLATKIAALQKKFGADEKADRIADVEVYLDAVRRPLKYATNASMPAAGARRPRMPFKP